METVDGFVSEMSGGRWAVHSFAHPESVLEGSGGEQATCVLNQWAVHRAHFDALHSVGDCSPWTQPMPNTMRTLNKEEAKARKKTK